MSRNPVPLVASRRPGRVAAPCWRAVVRSALDGWPPREVRIEMLLDWMERTT